MLATAESKNQAVSKLESLIERGRSRAANVIDHVSLSHLSGLFLCARTRGPGLARPEDRLTVEHGNSKR